MNWTDHISAAWHHMYGVDTAKVATLPPPEWTCEIKVGIGRPLGTLDTEESPFLILLWLLFWA